MVDREETIQESSDFGGVTYVWRISRFLASIEELNSGETIRSDAFFQPWGKKGFLVISKDTEYSTTPAFKLKYEAKIYSGPECKHVNYGDTDCSTCADYILYLPDEDLGEISCLFKYYGYQCSLKEADGWENTVNIKRRQDDADLEEEDVSEIIYVSFITSLKNSQFPFNANFNELQDGVICLRSLGQDLDKARAVDSDVTFIFQDDVVKEELSPDANREWISKPTPSVVNVKAHKWLLMARSSVFKSLYNSGTEEAVTQQMLITDFTPQEFEVFLQCLYQGRIPVKQSLDTYLALSRAAYKYNMSTIARNVGNTIALLLTKNTVSKILLHADSYNDMELLGFGIDFLLYFIKEIDEPVFDCLANNPRLAKRIMTALVNRIPLK